MRVAIDARAMFWPQSGISRNLRGTVRHLIQAKPVWEFQLLFNRGIDARRAQNEPLLQRDNVAIYCLQSPVPLYEFGLLPLWLLANRPDVFVSPTTETFPVRLVPTLVYIYDLIPEQFPRLMPYRHRMLAGTGAYRTVARMADRVVTLSENTKHELERHYRLDPDKIKVIPGMLDEVFHRIDPKEAARCVRQLLGGEYRVVLSMNTVRMAEFVQSCSLLLDHAASDVRVVLVGRPGNWAEFRLLLSEKAIERFIVLDQVTDFELLSLYNHAECFVFPSYYEGFGYPPIEAMACGSAVIIYSSPTLAEVVGDAALKVNPGDIAGLAAAISALLSDSTERRRLAAAGLARVSRFSARVLIPQLIRSLEDIAG